MKREGELLLAWGVAALLSACGTVQEMPLQAGHLQGASSLPPAVPAASAVVAAAPLQKKLETYNIVASRLPVTELLFVLARDARINLDVHPGITGVVTLNVIGQTLPQIMERITAQVDLRWRFEKGVLTVLPDTPYLQSYRIDYLNLSRQMKSSIQLSNSLRQAGSGNEGSGSSETRIEGENRNHFWSTLESNLNAMLDIRKEAPVHAAAPIYLTETPKAAGRLTPPATDMMNTLAMLTMLDKLTDKERRRDGEKPQNVERPAEAVKADGAGNLVVVHPETGTISIRASHKNQRRVAEYLAQIQSAAHKQVMIEATIVEVVLSDSYQAGVDWAQLASGAAGWSFAQNLLDRTLLAAPTTLINYKSRDFNATLAFLAEFGKTRVLSSPKIVALNNQTALMRVVEELVYFSLTMDEDRNSDGNVIGRTYTSKLNTVPVGLVMQVTPQVAESGAISLNVRPTVTNVSGYVEDPALALAAAGSNVPVKSMVPILQVREFDSTLRIASGQLAILGGLIQDRQNNQRQGVPGLSKLPVLGDFFSYRDDKLGKIELVVFLRPKIVDEFGRQPDGSPLQLAAGDAVFDDAGALSAFASGTNPWPR